jgi:hypothetical protein
MPIKLLLIIVLFSAGLVHAEDALVVDQIRTEDPDQAKSELEDQEDLNEEEAKLLLLGGNKDKEEDRPEAKPFEDKVPLYCFDYSIRTRARVKTYASCKDGVEKPELNGPAENTDTAAYKRWVHKHVHQAADCFGADPAVLFALWSGESGFQVNIKNMAGGPDTGFAQLMVGTAPAHDVIQAVAKFNAGTGQAIPADKMEWLPKENREKLKNDPSCKAYLNLAYWGADRMARGNNKSYCAQARDLISVEPGNLERSVQLNAVMGVINHMRALAYASKSMNQLEQHLVKNVPAKSDREKILAAVKIQAGWGQGGPMKAVDAVIRANVKSFEDFDTKLGSAKEFDLYARAKKQTFQDRLLKLGSREGKGVDELQKCAPFVKKPSR